MDVYVIRHTAVAVESGICYGQSDVALAETFKAEAEAVVGKIPPLQGCAVYSSPLSRCRKLADVLAADPVIDDARLLEMHFGHWELCRWDDLHDENVMRWMDDFVEQRCVGGESYRDLFLRVRDFWNELVDSTAQTAVIVTHSGVIRALTALWLDMPLQAGMRVGVDFGGVTKVRQTDYGSIVEYVNR